MRNFSIQDRSLSQQSWGLNGLNPSPLDVGWPLLWWVKRYLTAPQAITATIRWRVYFNPQVLCSPRVDPPTAGLHLASWKNQCWAHLHEALRPGTHDPPFHLPAVCLLCPVLAAWQTAVPGGDCWGCKAAGASVAQHYCGPGEKGTRPCLVSVSLGYFKVFNDQIEEEQHNELIARCSGLGSNPGLWIWICS